MALVPANSWSSLISDRYEVCIEEGLAQWFDDQLWKEVGEGEFNTPLAPESLLADAPEALWPGLMLPDCLPIVGNRYGDWLCLRVGPENRFCEVIHWYHGGGDWIPWGGKLAEALVFEAVRHFLPGRRQFHSISAEPLRYPELGDPLIRWAVSTLPKSVADCVLECGVAGRESYELAETLLRNHIAAVAVHCELALTAIDSPLRSRLTPELANQLGLSWEPDAIRWLFDPTLAEFKDSAREQIRGLIENAGVQDWHRAQNHCAAVADTRDDLGWAFDVLGWSAERAGEYQRAAHHYAKGALASSFSDQSIRFRTHWFPPSAGKFSLWRLKELQKSHGVQVDLPAITQGYCDLFDPSLSRPLPAVVSNYWNQIALQCKGQGDWKGAYDAYYRGGWDVGIDRISNYRQQLSNLIEAARNAGQTARAAVAQSHLNTFCQRYGEQ